MKKKLIKKGHCLCGCGQKTKIAQRNHTVNKYIKGEPINYIHGHNQKKSKHYKWNGGKSTSRDYIISLAPEHPRASSRGYVYEHILIIEKLLDKYLPNNVEIHHYDGRQNNKDLVVCENHKYHMLLHTRTRALKECGDPNKRKCPFCKQYDFIENMNQNKYSFQHRSCHNKYERNRLRRKKCYDFAIDTIKQRLGK